MVKLERELFKTYKLECLGVDRNNYPILPEENPEIIILKIYKSGESVPMCKYYNETLCTITRENHNYGSCPYRTFEEPDFE